MDHMLYNIFPFVPILCFWTIAITINVSEHHEMYQMYNLQ